MKRFVWVLIGIAIGCHGGGTDDLVGATCRDSRDCVERCERGGDFPDGFCTIGCIDDRDCPSDTACTDTHGRVCLFPCRDQRDCDFLGPRYGCREKRDPFNAILFVCMGN